MPVQTGGKRRKVRSRTKSRKRSTKKRTRSVSRRRKTTRRKSSGRVKLNKWQRFLKKHGGKGHSQRTLRAMYRREYM